MNTGVQFFELIQTGNFRSFTNLVDADPRLVMARDEHNWAPLHCIGALGSATTAVHAMMAKRLISEGADVNCRTPLGWTPIHMIAMQGQKEGADVARILIEGGADLKAIDNQGNDWKIHWQHGKEIRDILERAETTKPATGTKISAGKSSRPSIWPVLVTPLVAGVYYLALKFGFEKSLAIVGTLDTSFEFDPQVTWGVHWFYRLVAEVGSVALGAFIAAELARGRERIAGITAGLTIAIGFATFWLGFFVFGKLHDLEMIVPDPRDYLVPEPWYQHATDGLMIILSPLIGAYVSIIAQQINSRTLAGFGGMNRLHFLWLWFAAYFYGSGLAVPIGRVLTRSGGLGVSDLLTGALFGLPAAAIPCAAFLGPGYYGLALLSGHKGTKLSPATRNLLGVLVIFVGILVGGTFLIGFAMLTQKTS
jgi:hypothetical protein